MAKTQKATEGRGMNETQAPLQAAEIYVLIPLGLKRRVLKVGFGEGNRAAAHPEQTGLAGVCAESAPAALLLL